MALLFCVILLSGTPAAAQQDVFFADPALEAAVREAIAAPEGPLTAAALSAPAFTKLDASSRRITELSGIEACTALESLDLSFNAITSVAPLAKLTGLRALLLHYNAIDDLKPLAALRNLERLILFKNRIRDITPLRGLTKLETLYCGMNELDTLAVLAGLTQLTDLDISASGTSDLTPLAALSKLTRLRASENRIVSLAPLAACAHLLELDLRDNVIADLSPLTALSKLETLDLRSNPLNEAARCNVAPALLARGVALRITGDCAGDTDGDGLADAYETWRGISLEEKDSDGDGLGDAAEIWVHGSDPGIADSDGDGMPDGFEVRYDFDVLRPDGTADADGDGVANALEYLHGTDPRDAAAAPQPGKVAVDITEAALKEDLPWAPFRITNAGQLGLEWRTTSSDERVRVVRMSTKEMASMVQSRMPPRFWGLIEAGTVVTGGTGEDALFVLGTSYEEALRAEVVISNAKDPEERAVIAVHLTPRAGAVRVKLSIVVSPPDAGTVFLEPSGGEYIHGTAVKLGAVANEGQRFSHWQGDVADAETANTTITLESDVTVIAFFEAEGGGFPGCAAHTKRSGPASPGDLCALFLLAALLLRRATSPNRRGTRA